MQLSEGLKEGSELDNSDDIKKTAALLTVISFILTSIGGLALSQGWIANEIPSEVIMTISSTLVSAIFAVLGYIQVVTNKKIGIKRNDPTKE